MYSAIDEGARSFVQPFSEEAEGLWESGLPDSLPNMAALQLLSLAYIGHGKDHCVLTYRNEACNMAQRMCLVGVDPSVASRAGDAIPEEMKSPSSYAAWGIFNWTVSAANPQLPPVLGPRPQDGAQYLCVPFTDRKQPHLVILSAAWLQVPRVATCSASSRPRGMP